MRPRNLGLGFLNVWVGKIGFGLAQTLNETETYRKRVSNPIFVGSGGISSLISCFDTVRYLGYLGT